MRKRIKHKNKVYSSDNEKTKNILCSYTQSKNDRSNIIWNKIKAECKNIEV